jgi:hypothetical protein
MGGGRGESRTRRTISRARSRLPCARRHGARRTRMRTARPSLGEPPRRTEGRRPALARCPQSRSLAVGKRAAPVFRRRERIARLFFPAAPHASCVGVKQSGIGRQGADQPPVDVPGPESYFFFFAAFFFVAFFFAAFFLAAIRNHLLGRLMRRRPERATPGTHRWTAGIAVIPALPWSSRVLHVASRALKQVVCHVRTFISVS